MIDIRDVFLSPTCGLKEDNPVCEIVRGIEAVDWKNDIHKVNVKNGYIQFTDAEHFDETKTLSGLFYSLEDSYTSVFFGINVIEKDQKIKQFVQERIKCEEGVYFTKKQITENGSTTQYAFFSNDRNIDKIHSINDMEKEQVKPDKFYYEEDNETDYNYGEIFAFVRDKEARIAQIKSKLNETNELLDEGPKLH